MRYDDELRMEAYRFEGIVQPFPSHFHEHYVIGFVEEGEWALFCRDREYVIEEGSIVLFYPGASHACVQSDEGTFVTGKYKFKQYCNLKRYAGVKEPIQSNAQKACL